MRATRSFTGGWRCEVPITSFCLLSFSRASGLTFEGPQPNRPSAGFNASGILTIVRVIEFSVLGSDAGLPSVAWGRVAARPSGPPGRGANPRDLDLGESMYPISYEADAALEGRNRL